MEQGAGDAGDSPARSDRFRGCLLGLAVGDALGTTVEFSARGTFRPLTDMVGGGPFGLRPGEWTDDTSMALCLAASLLETPGFDPADQMRRYVDWRDHGYLSSNGTCFDIGNTIAGALARFERTGDAFAGSEHRRSAGNGCIMRLAPVPMFYAGDRARAIQYAAESARTTHAANECLEASRLLADILCNALDGADRDDILFQHDDLQLTEPRIIAVATGEYRGKGRDDVRGSGYVTDCLEAALWCFHRTGSFAEAVLAAANLGEDADTTAAVCGQVAGAHYGATGIPARWLERLAKRQLIESMAIRLSGGPPNGFPT